MGYTELTSRLKAKAYATATLFPANSNDGDLAIALDTDTLYTWNQPTVSWLAIATPGAAIAIDGLTGDVSASGPGVVAATVNSVGGQTAAAVASSVTGIRSIALGGTNQSAYTVPSGNICGLVYYDGTRFQVDPVVSHLGYDIVTDTVYTAALLIQSTTTNTARFVNTQAQSPTSGAGMSGFSDPTASILSGNRLGYYLLGGSLDAAHTLSNSAGMTAFATENWSGTAAGSRLDFETTANAGLVRSAKMTILGSGNIGIGTTAPGNLLHINSGATPTVGSVRLTANSLGSISYFVYAANNCALSFDSDYAGAAWVARDTTAFSIYKNSGNLNWYADSALTVNATFTPTNRMTLTNVGYLGIGLTGPTHKLEVTGVGQLTAALTDAGDKTNVLFLSSTSTSAGAGGSLVFGNVQTANAGAEGFAAIKGLLTNGAGTTAGALAFSTRNATTDTALTERARFHAIGGLSIGTNVRTGEQLSVSTAFSVATAAQTISSYHALSATVSDSGSKIGLYGSSSFTLGGGTQGTVVGILALANTAAGTTTNQFAISVANQIGATGAATTMAGISMGAPTVTAGGTVTNAYAINIANQGATGITNAYGLNIGAISGAATVNSAITTAGGTITFGDSSAKTAQFIFTTLNNNATSSTAAINKYALSVNSSGTWNGAGSLNVAFNFAATGGALNRTMMASMTDTSASGVPIAAVWTHTYTQSATAGSTDLNINRIETSIGSGVHKFVDFSVGGTSKFSVANTGDFTSQHHITSGTAPTIAAGAGAGTGPTISITGTDTAGIITLTTGTVPSASATIATVTFNRAYGAAPVIAYSPASTAATLVEPYVGSTTTTFTLNSGTVALAAATSYVFHYHVMQ